MAKYFILEQGHQKGPFSIQELKEQNIQPTTYIWTSGMDNWIPASEIDELSDLQERVPPSIPPMPSSFLIPSILATIFCCLPFGIVGIINALKVSDAYRIGHYDEANKYSETALEYLSTAVWTGISFLLLSITVTLIINFSNFEYFNIPIN